MASPHHHHHPHCHNHLPTPTTTTTTTCCFSGSYNQCCTQPHHPSPPPPTHLPADPLLQALASLIQQQQQQQQQPNVYTPHTANPSSHKNRHHQNLHFQPQEQYFKSEDQQHQQTQFVLSSLLQRITALESSLHHYATSNSTNAHCPSYSLRDTAARIIQTHFRAFLVRRSRALRQLKDLAFIKSSFNTLKSSISNKAYFDAKVVSHKATDLLLKLDSIQGGDPMIRDGKRAISRDLVRFLDFVDGFTVKRHVNSHKNARNVRLVGNSGNKFGTLKGSNGFGDSSGNQREIVEKLRERVERISGFSRVCENDQEDAELEGFQQLIDDAEGEIENNIKVCVDETNGFSKTRNGVLVKRSGAQPKVKKSVSFAENGNVYRVISSTPDSYVNEDLIITNDSDSGEDIGEVLENPFDETEAKKGIYLATGSDEEAHSEDGGSAQSSDDERSSGRNLRGGDCDNDGYCLDQNRTLVFSAPVPAKMESRADLMKKRKALKIVS
ncbi:hypothetical protein Tsubulata_016907 [Turnera subulata]|uniref:BAG domain-containing protein n=1 Tax=Turnera subulata TaxID=218843 RepID=A0A9Q0G0V5_9ROSI|nr:hypothetical protein Tsubulata_016907 [Turnera subulata]